MMFIRKYDYAVVRSVTKVGCGHAANCFSAAILMGLKAHAFAMPVAVANNLELRYQHDALRNILGLGQQILDSGRICKPLLQAICQLIQ